MDGNHFLNGRRMEDESLFVSNALELLLQIERVDRGFGYNPLWEPGYNTRSRFRWQHSADLVRLNAMRDSMAACLSRTLTLSVLRTEAFEVSMTNSL